MENYQVLSDNDLDGFAPHRRSARQAAVASAAALIADALGGRVPSYYLAEALHPRTPALVRTINANYPGIFRESMTTSDFPLLTGDVIDRMMLARYREFPQAWRQFASVRTVRDFRTVRRIASDGLEGSWAIVPEAAELTYESLAETGYTYAAHKYAQGAKFSFESWVNDDLGAFEEIPNRLGRGGARTVARFVTGLYVDVNGPHASMYTAGNGNIVTGNPTLSIAALNTAWGILRNMRDADGEPIMVDAAVLVVPPSLEVTARNILNATQVFATVAGGAAGQELQVANWIGASLTMATDPYIPLTATVANGATSWFIFAAPSVARPALEVGFVRGWQEPVLYQKQANTIRVGGGVDQMAGDFGTMSQEYKGVISFGGTRLDPLATVASNGSGVMIP